MPDFVLTLSDPKSGEKKRVRVGGNTPPTDKEIAEIERQAFPSAAPPVEPPSSLRAPYPKPSALAAASRARPSPRPTPAPLQRRASASEPLPQMSAAPEPGFLAFAVRNVADVLGGIGDLGRAAVGPLNAVLTRAIANQTPDPAQRAYLRRQAANDAGAPLRMVKAVPSALVPPDGLLSRAARVLTGTGETTGADRQRLYAEREKARAKVRTLPGKAGVQARFDVENHYNAALDFVKQQGRFEARTVAPKIIPGIVRRAKTEPVSMALDVLPALGAAGRGLRVVRAAGTAGKAAEVGEAAAGVLRRVHPEPGEVAAAAARPAGLGARVRRVGAAAVDAANLPRAVMASADLSAPLRQGAVLGVSRPRQAAAAAGAMMKAFARESAFDDVMSEIAARPHSQKLVYKKAGVFFSDSKAVPGGGEEVFRSKSVWAK